jgi:hypothetical protein
MRSCCICSRHCDTSTVRVFLDELSLAAGQEDSHRLRNVLRFDSLCATLTLMICHTSSEETMPILLNTVLESAGISIPDVRLLRHKDNRSEKGKTIYELWRDNRPSFDLYQSTQRIDNAVRLNASIWVAFIGTPMNETLFVGIYTVGERRLLEVDQPMPHMDGVDLAGTCHCYDLKLDDRLGDLVGRMVIDWGTGDRAWIQRGEFKEPEFPGFLEFVSSLSKLSSLPQSWSTALKSSRGIYLLTCPKTKEQYVGSASGEEAFWSRWQQYVQTGHGGNVALKSRDPSDYQVSILEVAGSADEPKDILRMEKRWKEKLQSQEMGLNRN